MIIQKLMLPQPYFLTKYTQNKGYVALMSVLIISALGAAVATTLLTTGTSFEGTSLALEQQYSANALGIACANVALEEIRLDSAYAGDENVEFAYGECDILPIDINGGTYTVNIEGLVGAIVQKFTVVVERTEDVETLVVTMSLQSFDQVADF